MIELTPTITGYPLSIRTFGGLDYHQTVGVLTFPKLIGIYSGRISNNKKLGFTQDQTFFDGATDQQDLSP
jgi:hypothetical protein